jgi:hypothetical protein
MDDARGEREKSDISCMDDARGEREKSDISCTDDARGAREKSDISAKRSGAAMYSAFECSRFGCWP